MPTSPLAKLNNCPVAETERSRANVVLDRVEGMIVLANDVVSTVDDLTHRLIGPFPQEVSGAEGSESEGFWDRLNERLDTLQSALNYLSESTRNINSQFQH